VAQGPSPRDASQSIIRLAHSSLPAESLRTQVLARIGRVVAADAIWWAGADPATLLFTNTERVGLPAASTGYFVDNEFLADDFNKWTELVGDPVGVRSLAQASEGALARSARYRDVFEPWVWATSSGPCRLGLRVSRRSHRRPARRSPPRRGTGCRHAATYR